MTTTSTGGVLGTVTRILNSILATVGLPLTPKFVAHTLTTVLTGTAVALLPLGLSTELNGVIVVVGGLVAHWLAPAS